MRLDAYLSERSISVPDFAKEIGVSPVSVWRYLSGARVPQPKHMREIMRVTDGRVTANDFHSGVAEAASVACEAVE